MNCGRTIPLNLSKINEESKVVIEFMAHIASALRNPYEKMNGKQQSGQHPILAIRKTRQFLQHAQIHGILTRKKIYIKISCHTNKQHRRTVNQTVLKPRKTTTTTVVT